MSVLLITGVYLGASSVVAQAQTLTASTVVSNASSYQSGVATSLNQLPAEVRGQVSSAIQSGAYGAIDGSIHWFKAVQGSSSLPIHEFALPSSQLLSRYVRKSAFETFLHVNGTIYNYFWATEGSVCQSPIFGANGNTQWFNGNQSSDYSNWFASVSNVYRFNYRGHTSNPSNSVVMCDQPISSVANISYFGGCYALGY